MAHTASQEHDLTLAQLEALAAEHGEPAEQPQLLSFLRHYFEAVPNELLAAHTPPELFAIAYGHWQFAREREGRQAAVRVFRPQLEEHRWAADLTVLETVVPDMPFLVDSLTMAVRAMGRGINWLVHPVLNLRRDSSGSMLNVSSAEGGSDGGAESLVHLEFMPVLSESGTRQLAETVRSVLDDLRLVVDDYSAMRDLMQLKMSELEAVPMGQDPEDVAEVQAFLGWLLDEHFTFLGAAESEVITDNRGDRLVQKSGSGLGLLRITDGDSGFVAPAQELDKYARSPRLLIVTKGNERSRLHHPEFYDAVVVKSFDEQGEVLGAYRFLGLFSSEVYNTLPRRIPGVRRKIEIVMRGSRLRDGSHAAKQLREILDNLPRDELFQSSEQELADLAMGIRAVRETQQLRLFMRRDRYGRFFSCLVYLDREHYSPEVRARMGSTLVDLLQGLELEHHVHFQRDGLARVQFIVRTAAGAEAKLSTREIEERLIASTRSWDDELGSFLRKILPDAEALGLAERFRGAFPASYREQTEPVDAATDVQYLNRLSEAQPMLVRLLELQENKCDLRLKIYVYGQSIALSDVLPTLENFGLKVHTQHPYEVERGDGVRVGMQEFDMQQTGVCVLTTGRMRTMFEEAFQRSWKGEIENDGINALVISAGLDWRQAALLRAICKYLLQTGMPYSQSYIESILYENAEFSRQLILLFEARFDPQGDRASREVRSGDLLDQLRSALDAVTSLDADRVLRAFCTVIQACLRTNFYQRGEDGQPKAHISLKLDPRKIPELPEPRPVYETFVYAPDVEGIHLRGGKVARGGLRWSDRREDFRTEVLGLVKAQMVKNAVIVPVGAKGGFVVKKKLDTSDREAFMATGIECYKTFVRGLLDITDNYSGTEIVPPPDVVRHDDDDPYLVVAADKGTATFSDIANGISAEYGFWLGDAFASGGSAGYDHKKMGITARGAWESVKRHFREMDIDCQSQEFSCVGVGDMAGDVFGNGMLLSSHTRLIAAFNHLHIFIDPQPDAQRSFAERKRLFELPRSSWADYERELISEGGGIFERKAKTIKLSIQARQALGIEAETLTPNELIRGILKAPVDLFWNGGIGTYVKARTESHQDVGDRANDALRVDGRELRCKLVGEGGNLGFTQRGRIEYSQHGGRVITDFIDNAGGVNSSDREVNIKIPLNDLMLAGALQRDDRDEVLESMTEDVAQGVLRDSYLQTLAISLHERSAVARLGEYARLMRMLEKDGLLNRAIEYLPDEEQIADRRASNLGLTRPEIAVLLSYSKISLYQSVLDSALPDDESLSAELLAYFPPAMTERFSDAIRGHRLRREIIATLTTNIVVNRMGMSYSHRVASEQGVDRAAAVKAYLMASRIFSAPERWAAIEELDLKLPTALQYTLHERLMGLLKHACMWLITHDQLDASVGEVVPRFAQAVVELEASLARVLPPAYHEQWQQLADQIGSQGVPEVVARKFADQHVLGSAMDIAQLAEGSGLPITDTAETYFLVGQQLSMPWLLQEIVGLAVEGRWHALARASLRDKAYQLHREIAARVLACEGSAPADRLQSWTARQTRGLEFAASRIDELRQSGGVDFLGLSVVVSDLQRLASDEQL